MVPHIVLEEIGTPYQRQLVDLARGEHKSDAYLKINPHGKVPALAVDDTVLTKNVAILTYLAKRFPEAQLLPDGMIEQARCVSMMAWFASAVHTRPRTAISRRPPAACSGTIARRSTASLTAGDG
jgi:glutathione S-transferase